MAGNKYPLSLVIRGIDQVTKPLQQINARLERTSSRLSAPFRRLGNRLSALSNAAGLPRLMEGFKGVGAAAQGVGGAAMRLGKLLAGMVGGALFGGYGLYALAKGAVDSGDALGEMAQRVGLGVDAYAQLQFAAAQADVGPEAFASAMDRLNKELGEMKAGGGSLLAFLNKVSPTLAHQVNGAKSTEQALELLTRAFEKVEDPQRRAALAAAAFGKSGLQMGQFLGQGSKAITEQRHRYLQLAGSQEALAAGAGALDNAMREAEVAFLGVRNATMTALFPALTKLATVVASFVAKNRDGLQKWALAAGAAITKWVESGGLERLAASIQRLAAGVVAVVDRLGGLESVAKLVALAMGAPLIGSTANLVMSLGSLGAAVAPLAYKLGVLLLGALGRAALGILAFNFGPLLAGLSAGSAAVWAFTASLLANPLTWIIAAIAAFAAAVYLIYKNWGPISAWLTDTWAKLASAAQTTWTGLKLFFVDLWDGITATFRSAWETIQPIIDKLMSVTAFGPVRLALEGANAAGTALFGTSPSASLLGADRAMPARAGAGSEARVQVDFSNLPRGTRVTTARDNTADVDMSLGYSMVGP